MVMTPLLKLTDAAVIVLVCKVAAWSILRDLYLETPGEALILAWYGLAALYGLAAWTYGCARQLLARLLLGSGAMASCAITAASDASGVVTWLDWTLLTCAFALRLGASRHRRKTPGENKQV